MGFFDDAVPGGNISKPVMLALGALLVGRMLGQTGSGQTGIGQAGETPAPQGSQGGGGFLGGLVSQAAGMLGGGGAASGGFLGGLSGLLQQFNQSGQGQVANSWVSNGPNQPIAPDQLGSALGQTTVSELARHAGISEQDLLAELSRVLPGVVDRLTPNGRVPEHTEVASIFQQHA
ncbi:MAG TPA: YidB family protein [Rhodopila sp.]|nr:YidB family protein [Rhodopila sp.]